MHMIHDGISSGSRGREPPGFDDRGAAALNSGNEVVYRTIEPWVEPRENHGRRTMGHPIIVSSPNFIHYQLNPHYAMTRR